MKLTKIALFGAALCAGGMLFGLDDCKVAKNWKSQFASNGKLEIAWDADAKAMRFTSVFKAGGKDNWLYPGIRISEADKKADFLEFEIRTEANPEGRGIRNCLVLFQNTGWKTVGQLYYPAPGKEFKKVKLDLRKLKFKMDSVWIIKIGLNFKDASEGALWLRSIAFTKAPAPEK